MTAKLSRDYKCFHLVPLAMRLICAGDSPYSSDILRPDPRPSSLCLRRISNAISSVIFAVMHFSPSCMVPCRLISMVFSRCVDQRRLLTSLFLGFPSMCDTTGRLFGFGRNAKATIRCKSILRGLAPSYSRKICATYPRLVTVPETITGVSLTPGTGFRHFLDFFL